MQRLLLAIAALGLAGTAAAQTPPAGDTAQPLTRAQAIARADARFARLDADHDGTVSPDERRAARAMRRRDHADHRVTAAEYRQRALDRFDRADTNHDGVLDAGERQAARDAMRDPTRSRDTADDGAPGPR